MVGDVCVRECVVSEMYSRVPVPKLSEKGVGDSLLGLGIDVMLTHSPVLPARQLEREVPKVSCG